MARCDIDGVLYRIFCVTLLSIAVFSTVVLINVVVDIDGVLTNSKVKPIQAEEHVNEKNDLEAVFVQDNNKNDDDYKTFNDDDEDDEYRTKRSLDNLDNVNKKYLTNHLAALLEELDEENNIGHTTNKGLNVPDIKVTEDNKFKEIGGKIDLQKVNDDNLHSSVHELILEGIETHSLFEDVYKKIHEVVHNKQGVDKNKHHTSSKQKLDNVLQDGKEVFADEPIHCKTLYEDIRKFIGSGNRSGSRLIINTVIDILPAQEKKSRSKERLKDIFDILIREKANDNISDNSKTYLPFSKHQEVTRNEIKNLNYYKLGVPIIISKIFKKYYSKDKVGKTKDNIEFKRIKRHIKLRYETDDKKAREPYKKDDELFVEIETHFDDNGLKGEKKKKLVNDLIEKIEKAIHNETVHTEDKKKKKLKHLHVKKRPQNPLDHKSKARLINKLSVPLQTITRREIDPIGKTSRLSDPVPFIDDKSGENWKIKYTQPNFLSPSKAINSAELSLVDTDYNRLLEINGIPQRLQKPINTEASEEIPSTYFDLGKLKFFVKDIANSGFSIGFNQYEDTPPDTETMKLFTGLENILENYHQNYDVNIQPSENFEDVIPGRDISNLKHTLTKRSIDNDYHSTENRFSFDKNYKLNYNDYKDIFRIRIDNSTVSKDSKQYYFNKQNIFKNSPIPADILRLADLFHGRLSLDSHTNSLERIQTRKIQKRFYSREKRSFKLKKINNLKNKIKFNRYLNTKVKPRKIFISKTRNKRQIGKIRIIATDSDPMHRHSDEDIFVVSDENIFADRAIVRNIGNIEQVTPVIPSIVPIAEEANQPEKELNYDYKISPYFYDQSQYQNAYSKNARNNALMSKYPHIFLEKIGRSQEYEIPYNNIDSGEATLSTIQPKETVVNTPISDMPAILNTMTPKSNYKLTVKLLPKNGTDINSGYKEIHTIINNSYNRDGLHYSSLVNVSEISKFIKLNKTTDVPFYEKTTQSSILKNMIEKRSNVKHLLERHKEKINSQLQRLNEEKEKVELLLHSNDTNIEMSAHNLEYHIPLEDNTPRRYNKYNTPVVRNNIRPTKTTEANQVTSTELDREKLVNLIQRNENITSEILKKIDQNTNLLQSFLQNVIKSIGRTNKNTTEIVLKQNIESNTEGIFKHNFSNPKDLNPEEFFSKTVPKLEIINNKTHVSIPFVYAYQKPNRYDEHSSVIYHGHIHTNTIPGKVLERNDNIKREVNQTKFFIDDLENGYKVIASDKKRAFSSGLIGTNVNGTV